MRALRKQVTGKLKTVGILHTHNRYGPVELRKMKDTTMQLVKAGHVVAHGHKVLDSHDRTFDGEGLRLLTEDTAVGPLLRVHALECPSTQPPHTKITRSTNGTTQRLHTIPLAPTDPSLSISCIPPRAPPPQRSRRS